MMSDESETTILGRGILVVAVVPRRYDSRARAVLRRVSRELKVRV